MWVTLREGSVNLLCNLFNINVTGVEGFVSRDISELLRRSSLAGSRFVFRALKGRINSLQQSVP